MLLVVQQVFIKALEFFHFKVLQASELGWTRDCSSCFTDKLLDANWNVLVDKVLHSLCFVEKNVDIFVDLVELALYLELLLHPVRFVLLGLLQVV